ncbi:Aste57867_12819 [Aphanomyces stellatus]|uniref:Aste57867_12819 protein n=1 Tax=Aphanomyces stellatus TaxID=120398 RepID=A0A485KWJ2_9STRA|nr:hypothetical protein As57867_012771 [Aphanomyces stellatus]VFT89666.1 Aste57867_12819 [Aphanomyces stellatus]
MLKMAMSVSPTSRQKRRRESHASISVPHPFDKCSKRTPDGLSPTDTSAAVNGGVLTTAFEPTLAQTEAEAIGIAAEMSIDFFNEAHVLYNMMSEIRLPTDEAKTMDVLMQRLDLHVHDENVLADAENVRNVYRGMVHVYVYLYRAHYRQFAALDMATHLSVCWHRLVAFVNEYHVFDPTLLHRSYEFTMQIVRDCERQQTHHHPSSSSS